MRICLQMTMLLLALLCSCMAFGFSQVWHGYKSFEYYIVYSPLAQYDVALKKCTELNGTLALVKSNDIHKFLVTAMQNDKNEGKNPNNFYIGLTRASNVPNGFAWTDGTPLESFNKWKNGEPSISNGNKKCVKSIFYENVWSSVHCDTWLQYICQRRVVSDDLFSDHPPAKYVPNYIIVAVIVPTVVVIAGIAIYILKRNQNQNKKIHASIYLDDNILNNGNSRTSSMDHPYETTAGTFGSNTGTNNYEEIAIASHNSKDFQTKKETCTCGIKTDETYLGPIVSKQNQQTKAASKLHKEQDPYSTLTYREQSPNEDYNTLEQFR